jgi:hypothetical protein
MFLLAPAIIGLVYGDAASRGPCRNFCWLDVLIMSAIGKSGAAYLYGAVWLLISGALLTLGIRLATSGREIDKEIER